MGCFCAVPEEFYCEVLLLDESKLTLTTQQQGIKVSTAPGAVRGLRRGGPRLCLRLSPVQLGHRWKSQAAVPGLKQRRGVNRAELTWSCLEK